MTYVLFRLLTVYLPSIIVTNTRLLQSISFSMLSFVQFIFRPSISSRLHYSDFVHHHNSIQKGLFFYLEIQCLKRTWLISGMQHHDGRSGGNNVIDQQTQTPGDGVSVAFRTQLKNATRNIKNRWSSSGADAAAGMAGMMSGSTEESQSLLSGAGDLPHETPTHRQHQQDMVNRNLHHPDIAPPPYPPSSTDSPPTMPSTSQLQCAINLTLKSSHESNTLSTTAPDPLLNSGHDVLETIC